MITPSMSHFEIYEALYADRPELSKRAECLIPKVAGEFKKANQFPAWKYKEYTHIKSHNRYLISFYAPTSISADCPIIKYLALAMRDEHPIVIEWGCWLFIPDNSKEAIATRYIGYYTSHFFAQYKKRIWPQERITRKELICRYFSHNNITIPLEMNKDINRNYKQYGDYADVAFKVQEGTCFIRWWNEGEITTVGQNDCDFISVALFVTFVSVEMMHDSQKQAIQKEAAKFIKSLYNRFIED